MARLKMFWWNEVPNFGDALSPIILERLFEIPTKWADLHSAMLVGAGSCLQWVAKAVNESPHEIHVWGTGYIFDKEPAVNSPLVQHHAVRGKKSQIFGNLPDLVLGDPAILSSLLFDIPVSKKYRVGIVPHLWNMNDNEILKVKENYSGVFIIDVTLPALEVIELIASCDFIFSSSLHGLIVADSLGIPNQWVTFSRIPFGGDWKFNDYYSVYDIPTPKTLKFTPSLAFSKSVSRLTSNFRKRNGIYEMQAALIKAFPKDIHI